MKIFSHDNYLNVLKDAIKENGKVYGYRAQLAEAAGCQRSFMSQVLHGKADLLLEHAAGLAKFWNLTDGESDFFILQVSIARAGSPQLADILRKRLNRAREDNENLRTRFNKSTSIQNDSLLSYYSSWHLRAIHMALTVPAFQTPSALARRFELPLTVILQSLSKLEELGLAQTSGKEWSAIKTNLHLGKESVANTIAHSVWRQQAVLKSQILENTGIHYTAIYTLSAKDVDHLKKMMLEFIDSTRKMVEPSEPQEMMVMTCDLFSV